MEIEDVTDEHHARRPVQRRLAALELKLLGKHALADRLRDAESLDR